MKSRFLSAKLKAFLVRVRFECYKQITAMTRSLCETSLGSCLSVKRVPSPLSQNRPNKSKATSKHE